MVRAPPRGGLLVTPRALFLALLLASGCTPSAVLPLARPDTVEARDEAVAARCGYRRGVYLPEAETPIAHVLVLVLENRSYDHYFDPALPRGDYCGPSPNHSWIGTHVALRDGYSEAARVGLTMPYYAALYGAFASSSAHYSGLPGPTWPNRYMMLAGTSYGLTSNAVAPAHRIEEGGHLLADLDRARVPWRVYFTDVPFALGAFPDYGLRHLEGFHPIADLYEDLASGDLPGFALIEPGYIGPGRTDEHAPANPQIGQAATAEIVRAFMASPAWPRSVLIITYDEGGGFHDGATPPEGCNPGRYPVPEGLPGRFSERGPRVPLVVVSPWARRGYQSTRTTDAASILRLVQWFHGLPALTGRDANAWPLWDLFDFEAPPRLTPPALPEAEVVPCAPPS